MLHKVKTVWKEKMAFDSQIDKHTLRIDTSGDMGNDSGPGPKKTVVGILNGLHGNGCGVTFKKNEGRFL